MAMKRDFLLFGGEAIPRRMLDIRGLNKFQRTVKEMRKLRQGEIQKLDGLCLTMPLFYTGVIVKETSPRAMRSIIHLPEQAVCKNRAPGIF